MLLYQEALDMVLKATRPLAPRIFGLQEGLGLVLAGDVTACLDQPPFNRSPYDGYAFCAADTAGAREKRAVSLRVAGTVPAGAPFPRALQKGEAVRILTGAMLPAGADAVAAQEEVEACGEVILLGRPYASGENVARAGEDISCGKLLLAAGCELGPVEAGLLSSQGMTKVYAHPRPVVAILGSGGELREAGESLAPGQIYNSNRHTLEALVSKAGGNAVYAGKVPDDTGRLALEIAAAAASSDLVLTTGGVSVGEFDLVPAAVRQAGAKLLFHRVAMKPGTPTLAAMLDSTLVIGLSGNPAACVVGFLEFALPVIKRLRGLVDWRHNYIDARVTALKAKASSQDRFLAARTLWAGECFFSELVARQKPGSLSSLVGINSLIHLPAGHHCPGEFVRVQVFPEIFPGVPLFHGRN